MPGTVILSHGSNSGPDASKVAALAAVAAALGWRTLRPDYRADDALGYAGSVPPRVARLVAAMRDGGRPLVLVGSSMGAFTSGLAALEAPCDGIFLMALPVAIPGCARHLELPRGVPSMLVHGWNDEVCPAAQALDFARAHAIPTLMLDGDHRLGDHLHTLERQFELFLRSLAS